MEEQDRFKSEILLDDPQPIVKKTPSKSQPSRPQQYSRLLSSSKASPSLQSSSSFQPMLNESRSNFNRNWTPTFSPLFSSSSTNFTAKPADADRLSTEIIFGKRQPQHDLTHEDFGNYRDDDEEESSDELESRSDSVDKPTNKLTIREKIKQFALFGDKQNRTMSSSSSFNSTNPAKL